MIGLTPSSFWAMTPWQFKCCIEAYTIKNNNDYDLTIYAAWLNANFQRAKKIPSIKDFLTSNKKIMKRIDEPAIIARLKAYQRKKDGKDS